MVVHLPFNACPDCRFSPRSVASQGPSSTCPRGPPVLNSPALPCASRRRTCRRRSPSRACWTGPIPVRCYVMARAALAWAVSVERPSACRAGDGSSETGHAGALVPWPPDPGIPDSSATRRTRRGRRCPGPSALATASPRAVPSEIGNYAKAASFAVRVPITRPYGISFD